jgi:hypothetical protein
VKVSIGVDERIGASGTGAGMYTTEGGGGYMVRTTQNTAKCAMTITINVPIATVNISWSSMFVSS